MGGGPKEKDKGWGFGPAEVEAFLRAHPGFLAERPALLQLLTPPAEDRGQGVYDFQRFMLERLQRENVKLADLKAEIVATSRANMNSQNRIHVAVLFLLDARNLEQLIHTITTDLAVLLDVDVAALVVESNGADVPHVHRSAVRVVEPGFVDTHLGRRDVALLADAPGDPAIYGPGAGLVRSQALIRLTVSPETPVGLLAFGSRTPDAFADGQGTELIAFLGRVVERCIRNRLDLGEV